MKTKNVYSFTTRGHPHDQDATIVLDQSPGTQQNLVDVQPSEYHTYFRVGERQELEKICLKDNATGKIYHANRGIQ